MFGEIAVILRQPMVLGEIIAGILLGPSVLGHFFPHFHSLVFPTTGVIPKVLDGFTIVAITLFLMVAGMEVDLKLVRKEGKSSLIVGLLGVILPFVVGFYVAYEFPHLLGGGSPTRPRAFPLFFATALSITALPVTIKTLMDLKMYRTEIGSIIVGAAIINDLIGWLIFALTLSAFHIGVSSSMPVYFVIGLTFLFTLMTLTVGRYLINRVLPFIQAHATWPGGVIGFVIFLALLGAAFTEWIGIHAIFGALLVGMAIGDSQHLRPKTRFTIEQFVIYVFAPLFFASIGQKVNFAQYFDWKLTLFVFGLGIATKLVACGLGALWSGRTIRESLSVGFGMSARGSMEIILSLIALKYGLINETLFIALVAMALGTSLISGPMIRILMQKERIIRFSNYLMPKTFIKRLKSQSMQGGVRELAGLLAPLAKMDQEILAQKILSQELVMPSGVEGQIAVPHIRLPGLKAPLIAAGISERGLDFQASDGHQAHLVILVMTGMQEQETLLNLLEDITDAFSKPGVVGMALDIQNYTEFLALVKTSTAEHG
jgi:Kef-type K+ transport system membrane component KefB/mannitol/fructose-specific phosphotransferase system IIA component (Ntr-type)